MPYSDMFRNVLDAGRSFLASVDREGCFGGVDVSQFAFLLRNTSDVWSLMLPFVNGERLQVSGFVSSDGVPKVSECVFVYMGERTLMSGNPSESVFKALGEPSGIPARLKSVLLNLPRQNRNDGASSVGDRHAFFVLLMETFFSGFDMVDADAGVSYRDRFGGVKLKYVSGADDGHPAVDVQSVCRVDDMDLTVSARMTVFGFSGHAVTVSFGLDESGIYSCDCRRTVGGMRMPSVVSAVRLIAVLSGSVKQRRKKTGMGRPRAGI